MDPRTQGSANPRLLKGKGWIRGCMHALACNDPACSFSACKDVKKLLLHIFSQPAHACNDAVSALSLRTQRPCSGCSAGMACFPVRALLSHWVQCQSNDALMEGGTSDERSSLPVASLTGGHDTASVPPTPNESSCTDATPPHSWNSIDQPNSNFGDSIHTPSMDGCNAVEQDFHVQVIYFLELLLQCFVQKAPINKHSQDQLGWLITGKQLWQHLLFDCTSTSTACPHPGCKNARVVLCHRIACQVPHCAICAPVKQFFRRQPTEKANVPNMQVLAEAIDKLSL